MTPQETGLLVGALIGVLGAIQAWLVSRTVTHGKQLNGLMTPRIAHGAAKVVAADHVARGDTPTVNTAATRSAHIAALKSELATLEPPTLPPAA